MKFSIQYHTPSSLYSPRQTSLQYSSKSQPGMSHPLYKNLNIGYYQTFLYFTQRIDTINQGVKVKSRRRSKYHLFQLIWEILLVAFLLLGIISWGLYRRETEEARKQFYKESQDLMARTAFTLEGWLDYQIQIVQLIAEDPRVMKACADPRDETAVSEATRFLEGIHRRFPYFENLPLVSFVHRPFERSVSGETRIIRPSLFFTDTVGGFTIGKGGMSYSYIREIADGDSFFISEVYPSILRGNPIFVISAPVYREELLVGVAIISPQMEYFTKTLVDTVEFGEEGYLIFMNKQGEIIAHPDRSLILSPSEEIKNGYKPHIQELNRGNLQFKTAYRGVEKYYNGRRLNLFPYNSHNQWYLLAARPVEEIEAEAFHLFLISLSLLVVMVLALIGGLILLIFKREGFLIQRTKELENQAQTDPLSGLLNRGYFFHLLDEKLQGGQEQNLTVILLDLDHFKDINDRFGHPEGDRVIVQTAAAIQKSIRRTDIAGRYGGGVHCRHGRYKFENRSNHRRKDSGKSAYPSPSRSVQKNYRQFRRLSVGERNQGGTYRRSGQTPVPGETTRSRSCGMAHSGITDPILSPRLAR